MIVVTIIYQILCFYKDLKYGQFCKHRKRSNKNYLYGLGGE